MLFPAPFRRRWMNVTLAVVIMAVPVACVATVANIIVFLLFDKTYGWLR